MGWYKEVWINLVESSLATSFIICEVNIDPLSHNTCEGKPILEKMLSKASATTAVSIDRNAIASGYRVETSTRVRM